MKTREEQLNRILQEAVAKAGKAAKMMSDQRDTAWKDGGGLFSPAARMLVVYQPDIVDDKIDLSKVKVTCGTRQQLYARQVFLNKNLISIIRITNSECYWYFDKFQTNEQNISEAVECDIEMNGFPVYAGLENCFKTAYDAWINGRL